MRRASLAAPLLLIGIGVLFLARNMFPELPLLDYLAKYWPLLLILWGVLRFVEIVFWAATSRPLPPAGVGGGEWVLVILLCIFGFSLHAARGFSNFWPRGRLELGGLDMFGESFEYPISGETAASPSARVVIENFRGNAHITGGDVASVKVTGRKTIRSMDQDAADARDRESPFELAGDPNRVVIRTNQDRPSGPARVSAELDITVPKGASIEAHGRSGDFDVSGINGAVDISSDNSGVRMENVGGPVHLDLRRSDIVRAVNLKGTLDLKGTGSDVDLENIDGAVTINGGYRGMVRFHGLENTVHFTGPQTEFSAEKIPGEVRMPLGEFTADNLVGPVSLHAASRDVQITGITNSLNVEIARGDIELRPGSLPLSKMEIRTRAGDIELALPEGAKFDLNASSQRGEATNDFGAPLREEATKHGASIRGSNGGPQVDLETDRGRVTVRKAGPGDAAPAFPQTPAVAPVPGVLKAPGTPRSLNPIQQ